jgi:hypothetical protein
MDYFLNALCLEKEGVKAKGCLFLHFRLDAEKHVQDVWFITSDFDY